MTGGYKDGRTMNWLIGVGLLLLVLASNFTGYLLPWDQLAYWAITVSASLLAYIPLLGVEISHFILAGPEVGQGALSNFYALHVVVLPAVMMSLMAYHFWKIRKNGGLSQPQSEQGRSERLTTLPHLVRIEAAAMLALIAALMLFSMLRPAPTGPIANPLESPNPAKAAWYFLGLQELLLHMHPLAAISLVALALLGRLRHTLFGQAHGRYRCLFPLQSGTQGGVDRLHPGSRPGSLADLSRRILVGFTRLAA